MNYYLQTGTGQVNAISTQTYGRLIKELQRFKYDAAASVLQKLRDGAKANKPYQCNWAEIKTLYIARGATDWIRNVLTHEWLGDGIKYPLTLLRTPYVKPKPVRLRAKVSPLVKCPHCTHEFVPS